MRSMEKKCEIGIIQNKIGVSGRNVVISEFTRWCNQKNIIPTIFTFSGPDDIALFHRAYGPDIKFKTCSFKLIPITRGGAYQTPLLNMLTAWKIDNYDLIFNSGRCPYFLPEGPDYWHYVHFPLEATLDLEEHLRGLGGYLYTLPLKALYWHRTAKVRTGYFLANSQFTAAAIQHTYRALDPDNIDVVYPPCAIPPVALSGIKDLDFVSLGSFVGDKRQLEQLMIAQQIPESNFHLVGGVKSKRYFKKCQEFIHFNRLQNVTLLPNASKSQVEELLSRSKYFLHTKRNEHFGISTVEAIGHGCMPIVHDSGGQKEIVYLEKMRFKDTEEAVKKCQQALNMTGEEKWKAVDKLRRHIYKYSVENFRSHLNEIFEARMER